MATCRSSKALIQLPCFRDPLHVFVCTFQISLASCTLPCIRGQLFLELQVHIISLAFFACNSRFSKLLTEITASEYHHHPFVLRTFCKSVHLQVTLLDSFFLEFISQLMLRKVCGCGEKMRLGIHNEEFPFRPTYCESLVVPRVRGPSFFQHRRCLVMSFEELVKLMLNGSVWEDAI